MAEYAGLEIRIGGNTTKLNSALKASTKSAAELQSRIRQVTKAMRFDPTDLRNVETRIKLTGDRMQSLQSKAKLMATSMKQLGDSVVTLDGTPKTIRQIATETDNLSLTAKQADQRYANLTGSLAEIYDAWNKLTREEGVNFAEKLQIDPKTARHLMDANTSLIEMRSTLKGINRDRREALDSDSFNTSPISPEDIAKLERLKSINFHNMFKNGLDLDTVAKEARDFGVAISDSAIDNVRELQTEFKKAAQEKKVFDDALQFDQLSTGFQQINSEAESLSQTMRWLDDGLTSTTKTPWFQGVEADIRKVDAALDNVEKDLERTEDAMKVDPKNIGLAARYMQDLQQKVSLSEEKSRLLKTELGHLDASGAKDAAKSHQDLAKWIEESAENARVAEKALSDQRAEVQNLEDSVKKTTQHLATAKKDLSLIETTDNAQKYAHAVKDLAQANKDLANAQKGLEDNKTALANARQGYSDARDKVDEYTQSINELKQEQQECLAILQNSQSYSEDAAESALARYDDINTEMGELNANLAKARKEAQEFNGTIMDSGDTILTSEKAIEGYNDEIAELEKYVEKLSKTKEVKLLQDPGNAIANEEAALKDLEVELKKARYEEQKRQNAYDSAAAENNLAKEAKAYDDIEQQIEEARVKMLEAQEAMGRDVGKILNPSTLKSLGMTFSATVTPLLAGIGRSMLDASTDIDTAYRNMRKTVDGTDEQFEQLRKHAMDFATTHVTSADQLLEIEAIGGELGVATDNLTAFAEAISNIDVASNLNTEEAAEALGHLSNIMHLTADDYEGFSNALVRLGNNGASTESEIANIAERIGSMGSIVGMSASDVLAWASSIASTGQNAEAAGTAISKTMSFFETAVAAAGGSIDTSFDAINSAVQNGGDELTIFANLAGKSAEEFAEAWESDADEVFEELSGSIDSAKESLQMIADVAHMTADDFTKTWESDPTSAMKAFIEGLNDIEASGGSADSVLQGMGITAVRQKQAIEGLMQTVGGLDDNLQMSRNAWNGISDQWGKAGDAANEAAKKAEGFSGQMQIMKNMWHNALAELGEGAAPWLQRVSGALGSLTEVFSGLSQGAKETIVALGGIAFATGPVLTLVSTLGTATGNVKKWVSETVTGLSIVQDTYDSFGNEGVKALTGMSYGMASFKLIVKSLGAAILKSFAIGGAIAAVVALGTALKNLYDQYQDHIAATKGLREAIGGIGDEVTVATSAFNMTGSELRGLASDSKGYESRLADLTHTIEESNDKYSTYAGTLSYYGDTVRDLAGKEGRTKEESAKLAAALQGINDACGTTYGLDEYGNIIDTQTGKIQANTDAIDANVNARRNQALMEYYNDDYAKAVGQLADAQDKLNKATDDYNKLASDSGKKEYLDHAKQVYGATYDEQKVLNAYNAELEDAKTAMSNYSREVGATEDALEALEGKMGKAQEDLDKANKSLEDAAAAQEEYSRRSDTIIADVTGNMKRLSDSMGGLGSNDAGFNAVVDGLSSINVYAHELNNVDMSRLAGAFDSANGSMEKIIKTLQDGGVNLTTWNSALEQAPEAAEKMGSLTAAAFQSMYDMAGQDINATMTLIAGLDAVQVGDKTFYIGDNGSIADSQGKVYDIKNDLADIPDQVITQYYVDDADAQKKALDTKAKLTEVNKQKTTATIGVKDNASKPTETLQNKLRKLNGTSAKPTANLTDYASSKISSISRNLTNLNGKSATVTIYEKTVKKGGQATGGMNNRPVIPEHASGYIATGPTLTNQGWIGEDGIEAVANWATGGAVVPLTNKKYMLPIADAIAEGMASRMGGSGVTYNTYINDAIVNGDEDVQNAVLNLLSTLQRKGAMNRG
jgi:DNA repair exonuclease SbcCD ATPase subunit